jgi:hypothetical protein
MLIFLTTHAPIYIRINVNVASEVIPHEKGGKIKI